MAKDTPADLRSISSKNLEQAQDAMDAYLRFLHAGMSAASGAGSEFSKKMASYTQQNIQNSFDLAKRVTQAKDLREVMQIQADYFREQLSALSNQAKDLHETLSKAGKPPNE